MRVTEYAGPEGLVSSARSHSRFEKPRPGDLIRWEDGRYGMVEEVGTGFCEPDQAHVVERLGSAFLGRHKDGRIYVSISGGPFRIVDLTDLDSTYEQHVTHFWNWGDNTAGADKGVDFYLARPVFAFKPTL